MKLDDVSRETRQRLEIYRSLLLKWNRSINLVSPDTIEDAEARHFEDSLQLLDLAPTGWKSWADLGSGGGFPGLVIAMSAPEKEVTLIESDRRKAGFLKTVVRETGVRARIVVDRIEAAPSAKAEVVSARALAPLGKLLSYVERHIAHGGCALLPKGRAVRQELETALEDWRFDCEKAPSKIDPDSVILKIGDIRRVRADER